MENKKDILRVQSKWTAATNNTRKKLRKSIKRERNKERTAVKAKGDVDKTNNVDFECMHIHTCTYLYVHERTLHL